jgi:hypothetical protein
MIGGIGQPELACVPATIRLKEEDPSTEIVLRDLREGRLEVESVRSNIPDLKCGTISSIEPVIHADATPPCKFCDIHKRDIHRKGDCTPAQECHADYWSPALKEGAKR